MPAALYAGGFHNFNPNGLDVAQTVNIGGNNAVPIDFQWNDPYDQNTSVHVTGTLLSTTGNYTNATAGSAGDQRYTATGTVTAGVNVSGPGTCHQRQCAFDGIVTVYKSDGTTVIAGPARHRHG